MKKRLNLLIGCLFLTSIVWSQANQRVYTPSEMREDLDTLVKYLEDTHPDIYYRYSKENFYGDVGRLKKSLTKNLTRTEFYFAAEPLLSKFDDGHTDFHIIEEYNSQNPVIIPYFFKVSPAKPFIVCAGAYKTVTSQLPNDAEILSINDIPSSQIAKDIIRLNTGENEDFRAEFGSNYIYFYLEALYHANGRYNIKYKNNGKIKTVLIYGIRSDEINDRIKKFSATTISNNSDTEKNFSLEILDQDKTAIIKVKSFEWEGYQVFIDSAFKEIKRKEIKNLIIDLIDNGGGDSDIGDDFLQYILDHPFRQYNKAVVKNSRFYKERLKAQKPQNAMDANELEVLRKANGTLDTIFYENIKIDDNALRFGGKVYVLINLQTYSSAADFAQCFSFYKRGLVIGEESGGLIKSYGDIVPAKLPNTQLNLTISSTLYYNIGAGEKDWRGVMPDIKVPPQGAIAKALEMIRN
ncbi:hypothetical protein HYN59_05575 [Flavobacterium album]|uniref:Tail specific protease domain-containing protein n=1 Tax=Flavobacterium album TaxID=2175091 RepID=A0A2S1QWB1_9FLAO|nr:S41 family peptidase [Flavobacterium album]AWH84619.1 hypothetical protein HYN59_05575 [Flavobacterium album]